MNYLCPLIIVCCQLLMVLLVSGGQCDPETNPAGMEIHSKSTTEDILTSNVFADSTQYSDDNVLHYQHV